MRPSAATNRGRDTPIPQLDKRLTGRFFARPALEVAPALIGRTLFSIAPEGLVAGRIVEVEAYGGFGGVAAPLSTESRAPEAANPLKSNSGSSDPGSHAFRGRTPRNSVMFGPPGHLYVYFTYGMHHCANIVTDADGVAGAVLLRAVEPTEGLDLMAQRRGTDDLRKLARGPARLCQAFALDLGHNRADLATGDVWVGRTRRLSLPIQTSARVGLRPGMDQPWRFYEPGIWVSP